MINTSAGLSTTIIDSFVIKGVYSAIKQHLDTYIVVTNLSSKDERDLLRTKDLNSAKDMFYHAVACMVIALDDSIKYK